MGAAPSIIMVEKAGEGGDCGGYWVGIDDLNAALPGSEKPISLTNNENWPRLDNMKVPLLCTAVLRTGELGNGGEWNGVEKEESKTH